MKSKKIFYTLLIAGLLSSSCGFANGLGQESHLQTMRVKNVTPLEKTIWHVEENATSSSGSYSETFWVENSDGKKLRFYLENNGKQAVDYTIVHGKKALRARETIMPGDNKIALEVGKERAGRWTIRAHNSDGSKLNLEVKVKEFG